jgi:alpha-ketoglutarate-dependent taurine dioxygenase
MESRQTTELGFKKFREVKPKVVSVPDGEVVQRGYLAEGQTLPLVLQPAAQDVDLVSWVRHNSELVEAELLKHGAILFRGFGIADAPSFELLASALCSELYQENGEHPRESVSGNIYTPVFYPRDEQLLWHNENSFNHHWPGKILFCCVQPPLEGGETPIVDSRKVFDAVEPSVQRDFSEKKVMYRRNYTESLSLDWKEVFRSDDPEEVRRICERDFVDLEWRDDGGLRTSAIRPAVVRHPITGEMSWFNQAQHWHISCLNPEVRSSLEALFSAEDLPRSCSFGDGSPIEDTAMAQILDSYRKLEVSFPWQRGDVLMLDNVLVAHGRNRYVGERKLLVAMGEMRTFELGD